MGRRRQVMELRNAVDPTEAAKRVLSLAAGRVGGSTEHQRCEAAKRLLSEVRTLNGHAGWRVDSPVKGSYDESKYGDVSVFVGHGGTKPAVITYDTHEGWSLLVGKTRQAKFGLVFVHGAEDSGEFEAPGDDPDKPSAIEALMQEYVDLYITV